MQKIKGEQLKKRNNRDNYRLLHEIRTPEILKVSKCEKCGKVIVEPKENITFT